MNEIPDHLITYPPKPTKAEICDWCGRTTTSDPCIYCNAKIWGNKLNEYGFYTRYRDFGEGEHVYRLLKNEKAARSMYETLIAKTGVRLRLFTDMPTVKEKALNIERVWVIAGYANQIRSTDDESI